MPRPLLTLAALSLLAFPALSQTCGPPPAVLTLTQPNIFSEQQEQWLGDAMADYIERDYRPIKDPAQNLYLQRITDRLLATLPPTQIHFRALLVDSSEINGFSLAGGRVYITRKLVSSALNEDEIASVISHEMGHILSHQFAIETTASLKRLLNVTAVTDRADVYDKFQRLVEAQDKDKHRPGKPDSDEKQDEADRVGVYATAAAGYRPQAFSEFWDRSFFVEGKVGGRLSDFFGTTKPESKRLRLMLKMVAALPPGCGAAQPSNSLAYNEWHAAVAANHAAATGAALSTKPLAEVTLTPPLRMDLAYVHFSRDGAFVLAQDEASVFVLSRDPFKSLFRFDADRSFPALFSPDSKHIVFHTPGLHVEEWDIASQKMLSSHEPVVRDACLQTQLSPDGRTIVCVSYPDASPDLTLSLIDAASGAVVYEKKNFFTPNFAFVFLAAMAAQSGRPSDLLPGSFSPDGNTLVFGPGNAKLAFDLRTRTPIKLSGALKDDVTGPYAFQGNSRIVGVNSQDPGHSGVFSFPEGRQLQKINLGFSDLEAVSSGDYVMSRTLKDYAIGLADISTGKYITASHSPTLDVFDGMLLNENKDGSILLAKLGTDRSGDHKVTLPLSPLGSPQASAISPDGRYMALSTRSRGGIWDVATGRAVFTLRAFTRASFAPDGTLFAEFPKDDKIERRIVQFSPAVHTTKDAPYKLPDGTTLANSILLEWKRDKKGPGQLIAHDPKDNAVLWTRSFDGDEPAHAANVFPTEMLFSFRLKTSFAKARLKEDATLAAQAAAIKDKDSIRLLQVVSTATGKVLHEVILSTPARYDGVDGVNVIGDAVYVTNADNRSLVYSLASGAQLRQLFGYVVAADPVSGRICTVNRSDEAVIYDPAGTELARFRTGSPLRFGGFGERGATLIVLTADQRIRTLPIDPPSPTQTLTLTR